MGYQPSPFLPRPPAPLAPLIFKLSQLSFLANSPYILVSHDPNLRPKNQIFLETPKTPFLGHFSPFLVIFAGKGFFQKNWALPCISPHESLTA